MYNVEELFIFFIHFCIRSSSILSAFFCYCVSFTRALVFGLVACM